MTLFTGSIIRNSTVRTVLILILILILLINNPPPHSKGQGRLSVTGISQLWTPDLTNLMTRQLLEPTGQFWRSAGDPEDAPIKCLEADIQEFGERIAELAKVRKVMYFLLAFKDGAEKDNIKCTVVFKKEA